MTAAKVASGKESLAESFCGLTVGFGAGLGVDAEGEPRVGVSEPGLGGLEVDAFEDESGGVGPAEVVELGPLDAGLLSGWVPDPVQPVRVVEVLNHLARARMESEDRLAGPTLETRNGLTLQAGDRIVVRTNWYAHADLRNGQTGTVTNVDSESGQLTFRRDHDRVEVVLPRRYVDQSVDYGYAQTIHSAQGHTYGRVHIYVDQMMTAEHGYTGLSRASGETHIWMADPPGPLGDCSHAHCRPEVENRIDTLVRQLFKSGVRPAATESQPATHTMTDCQLIDRRDELARMFMDGPLDQPAPNIDAMARDQRRIDDHAHLLGEYTGVRQELDRRVAARALLYQTNPPQDILEQIGPRAESLDPRTWDAAGAVYAKTRLEVGPDDDITDPAVPHTGQWRDMVHVLQPIHTPAPTLRLTG